MPSQTSGTYVFATVEDYENFAEKVYEEGLDESYKVSSSDVSQYESGLLPLENLKVAECADHVWEIKKEAKKVSKKK